MIRHLLEGGTLIVNGGKVIDDTSVVSYCYTSCGGGCGCGCDWVLETYIEFGLISIWVLIQLSACGI